MPDAHAASLRPRRDGAGLLITAILAGLSMIGPFSIDMVFPAFTEIGGQFGASESAMQQVTSVYLLAFATMSIFHGPLADALGRKPVIIGGLAGFTAASVLCALAPSLPLLLVGRFLQGCCAGGATIVSRVVVRDLFSGAAAQRLMSNVMTIFAVAPAIAPIAGGWVLTIGPWPLVFWLVTAYAVAIATLTAIVLPETQPTSARQVLRARAVLAAVVTVARRGELVRISIVTAFVFGAQFVYIVGAPIIVVQLFHLGEQDFWVLFVPFVAGTMTGAWISGRVAERVPRRALISVGITGAVGATALNLIIVLVQPSLPWAMIGPPLLALSVGTIFPVLNLEILDVVPDRRGAAASVGTFTYLLFNAILAGVVIPFVTGSLVQVAACALTFAVTGGALWLWHRSVIPPARPVATP